MDSEDQSCRRQFYRVIIPDAEFVLLETKTDQYKVIEVSEGGISFEAEENLDVGKWVRGKVFYNGSDQFLISGRVLRSIPINSTGRYRIVAKVFNLSTPTVVALQSYIVRTYGPPIASGEN